MDRRNENRDFLIDRLHAVVEELRINSLENVNTTEKRYSRIWRKRMELTGKRVEIMQKMNTSLSGELKVEN